MKIFMSIFTVTGIKSVVWIQCYFISYVNIICKFKKQRRLSVTQAEKFQTAGRYSDKLKEMLGFWSTRTEIFTENCRIALAKPALSMAFFLQTVSSILFVVDKCEQEKYDYSYSAKCSTRLRLGFGIFPPT